MSIRGILFAVLAVVSPISMAWAEEKAKSFAVVNEDVGLPVFPYDFPDRKYEVLGEVRAGVRKATAFSKEPSQQKIYAELWERAAKLGADAVINASYGDSKITPLSWGKTAATGTAIRFVAEPAAPADAPEPAAPADAPEPAAPAEADGRD